MLQDFFVFLEADTYHRLGAESLVVEQRKSNQLIFANRQGRSGLAGQR
jgi:hypothetical protein